MANLRRIKINGFKSIKSLDLELRTLNILIGANGAGKSNLISYFMMLREMMAGRFQKFVASAGYGQSLLHYGPKVTPEMDSTLEFEVDGQRIVYYQKLFHTAGDKIAFAEESISAEMNDFRRLGSGHGETKVPAESGRGWKPAMKVELMLKQCLVFHFNDTSDAARMRQHCYRDNNRFLMPDASNLAAVLLRLKQDENATAYRRIVSAIQTIAPFFEDFDLAPDRQVILNWRENGSDEVFGPHQLSDGTLRAICLVTLLLQPEHDLPYLILVDEPELGLHPSALNVVAGLFRRASRHVQVLVSTQSAAFLDHFSPDDVIVVNRNPSESVFERYAPEDLENWLEEYSLGEIWEKNVIGGGPH